MSDKAVAWWHFGYAIVAGAVGGVIVSNGHWYGWTAVGVSALMLILWVSEKAWRW